jgi:hypothetical protein
MAAYDSIAQLIKAYTLYIDKFGYGDREQIQLHYLEMNNTSSYYQDDRIYFLKQLFQQHTGIHHIEDRIIVILCDIYNGMIPEIDLTDEQMRLFILFFETIVGYDYDPFDGYDEFKHERELAATPGMNTTQENSSPAIAVNASSYPHGYYIPTGELNNTVGVGAVNKFQPLNYYPGESYVEYVNRQMREPPLPQASLSKSSNRATRLGGSLKKKKKKNRNTRRK